MTLYIPAIITGRDSESTKDLAACIDANQFRVDRGRAGDSSGRSVVACKMPRAWVWTYRCDLTMRTKSGGTTETDFARSSSLIGYPSTLDQQQQLTARQWQGLAFEVLHTSEGSIAVERLKPPLPPRGRVREAWTLASWLRRRAFRHRTSSTSRTAAVAALRGDIQHDRTLSARGGSRSSASPNHCHGDKRMRVSSCE